MYKDKSHTSSYIFNIIVSLLVAVGIAVVFFSGFIASINVLVIITLVFGILGLLGLFTILFSKIRYVCLCSNISYFILSIVGSIVSSIFALTVSSLAPFSISIAILIGVVSFFLTSFLISLIELLVCIFCTKQCYNN